MFLQVSICFLLQPLNWSQRSSSQIHIPIDNRCFKSSTNATAYASYKVYSYIHALELVQHTYRSKYSLEEHVSAKNLNDMSKWAASELVKHHEVFAKVTEKLNRVIGHDRWVEEKDMPSLLYIKAILKESLRLHPVTPLLVPRRTREDFKVAGYAIPKETRILVSVWSIGKGTKLWDKHLGQDEGCVMVIV
ncbi:cytochrome P450 71A1-like protein [Tanacetum coccineum]